MKNHLHCKDARYGVHKAWFGSIIRIRMRDSASLLGVLAVLCLSSCIGVPTIAPLATLTGPTLEPSPTFSRPSISNTGGEVAPSEYVGISDPTAAAVAPESDLPPIATVDAALEANRQVVELIGNDGLR